MSYSEVFSMDQTTVSWPVFEGDQIVRRHTQQVSEYRAWTPERTPEAPTWTVQRVREHVHRAMDVLRIARLGSGKPADLRAWWPDVVRDATEAYGYTPDRAVRHATAEEIALLDRVLPWLFWIKRADVRKCVVGFALGHPSRRVGRIVGCSKDTARARELSGLREILVCLRRGGA